MSKPLHQPTEKTRAEIVALRSYGVPPKMTEQVARAVCEQWLNVNYSELSNDNQAKNTH